MIATTIEQFGPQMMNEQSFWKKQALVDLVIVSTLVLVLYLILHHYEGFEELYEFTRSHEDWELDEIILFLIIVPVPLAWYAWRRALEARRVSQENLDIELELAHSKKIAALGTLAGGMAHELNNHLVPVLGMSDLLLTKADANNPDRRKIELIHEGANRAKSTVQKILTFTRRQTVTSERCDPAAVVTNLSDILDISCPSSISLNIDTGDAVGSVNLGSDELESIIVNLFSNAVAAMEDKGGDLKVIMKHIPSPEAASIKELTSRDHIKITVEDTGAGIESKNLDRIFDPFFTIKEVGKGTGLGMW